MAQISIVTCRAQNPVSTCMVQSLVSCTYLGVGLVCSIVIQQNPLTNEQL